MGHEQLHAVLMERNAIYARADFTEADGIRSGELEAAFAEMNGYEAESQAAVLLNGLGIPETMRHRKMKELEGKDKIRVLLAQALFGNPDVLLLDEPTNHRDLDHRPQRRTHGLPRGDSIHFPRPSVCLYRVQPHR